MTFLEKLDFLMDKCGLNKRTLSLKSNIPYTTIDGWYKKGYEGLKLTTLRKLVDFFDTTLDYWIKDEITDPNYGKTNNFKISYEEMKYIEKYRSLDSYGQETVSYILEREADRVSKTRTNELNETHKSLSQYQPISLNQISKGKKTLYRFPDLASAGNGEYLFNSIPSETIEVDEDRAIGADFAIGVSGDSMEPVLYSGDIVTVQKTNNVECDDIGLFVIDNECFIKIFKGDHLHSLNEKYPDIPFGAYSDIRCIGKIVGAIEGERKDVEPQKNNNLINLFDFAPFNAEEYKKSKDMTNALRKSIKKGVIKKNGPKKKGN